MAINKGSSCISVQYHYLEPFSEDTPENIGEIAKVYNLLVKSGNQAQGTNTRRQSGMIQANVLPNVSARIFDWQGIDFSGFWPGTLSVNMNGGSVFINNVLIELESFSIDVFHSAYHWRLQDDGEWGFDAGNYWGFPIDGTGYGTMCVFYKPYETGTNIPTGNDAEIIMVEPENVDYDFMAPIVHIQTIRTSGTLNQVNFLLEHSDISDYPIEQVGYFRNFIVDGGNLG